jgi:hypothetical protein
MSTCQTKTQNPNSITFSHGIFLHAVDAQFEARLSPNKISQNIFCKDDDEDMMDSDINVKFFLSLDEEENFLDISTENNSDGEDNLKETTVQEMSPLVNKKFKINDLLEGLEYKTEIKKIRNETINDLRSYQMQMYNKFLAYQNFYATAGVGTSMTSKKVNN